MAVTVTFRPSIDVETPTKFKIFRKSNPDSPEDSFLEDDFLEVKHLEISGSPLEYEFTDNDGKDEYWYRVQTCDATRDYPLGPPLPGHGNSSFCHLRCGKGFLSCFQPGAIDDDDIWWAEHEATWYVLEKYLRNKYDLVDLLNQFIDPLPEVRSATATWAAMTLVVAYRSADQTHYEMLKEYHRSAAGSLGRRRDALSHNLTEEQTSRTELGSMNLSLDR